MYYSGGEYISQVNETEIKKAMQKWLISLDIEQIDNFSMKNKKRLIEEDFIDEDPIAVLDCTNIWCFGLRIKKSKRLASIYIIKTKAPDRSDI